MDTTPTLIETPSSWDGFLSLRDRMAADWPSVCYGAALGHFAERGGGLCGLMYAFLFDHPEYLHDALRIFREIGLIQDSEVIPHVLREDAQRALYQGLIQLCRVYKQPNLVVEIGQDLAMVDRDAQLSSLQDLAQSEEYDRARVRARTIKASHPEVAEDVDNILHLMDQRRVGRMRIRFGVIGGALIIMMILGVGGAFLPGAVVITGPSAQDVQKPPARTAVLSRANIRWCQREKAIFLHVAAHLQNQSIPANIMAGYKTDLQTYTDLCTGAKADPEDLASVQAEPPVSSIEADAAARALQWAGTPAP